MSSPQPAREAEGALDHLLTWRESSTSGEAIRAAVNAAYHAPETARDILTGASRVVLSGAGSSYYLALAVAAAAREATHQPYSAAPLSEILLRPGGVLVGGEPATEPVVVISRSGSTSEAVAVADRARELGHPTIAVTCRADSTLAGRADVTLVSPAGDEQAIVMTRSFASMLALLLGVVASAAGDGTLATDLGHAAERWPDVSAAAAVGRRFGATDWSRVVVLGGGAAFGIAAEWGLKLTETSQVATSAYEPLEFRHGPISVCEPGVLVVGLIGGAGAAEELRVVAEAAGFGAETWVLARDADEARDAPGTVSLIGAGLHPTARLPLLLHPAHALALTLALTRGCDPDAPRHLGQVVIIDPP
jgi:glucosamine--fructose-6-phosphate aminotransferase (isomerizing)